MELITIRKISDWMSDIGRGEIRIPKFQRHGAWKPELVGNFLSAILKDRPIGVLYVLSVKDHSPYFEGYSFRNAETTEDVSEHILDGQQRLRALWSSFNNLGTNKYIYYVEQSDGEWKNVVAIHKSGKYKSTIGNPDKEREKNWIPIWILNPRDNNTNIKEWLKGTEGQIKEQWEDLACSLKESFSDYVINFFKITQTEITQEEVISLYVEINKSSVSLSPYGLAVAEMEKALLDINEDSKQHFYDLIKDIEGASGGIRKLEEQAIHPMEQTIPDIDVTSTAVGELVLKIEYLRQKGSKEGERFTNSKLSKLCYRSLLNNKNEIIEGIKWTKERLEELHLYDNSRLPTTVPLRVLPALHAHYPTNNKARGEANKLVTKYLWCCFLTSRYETRANEKLANDYRGLMKAFISLKMNKKPDIKSIPIFREPLPTKDKIAEAGWPKYRNIFSRGLLTFRSHKRPRDIVTNNILSGNLEHTDSRRKTEYHHIFPDSYFGKGKVERRSYLAMNCLLLQSETNKEWGKDLPWIFLNEWIEEQKNYRGIDEETIREDIREYLNDHLIDIESFKKPEDDDFDLATIYDAFIKHSACKFEQEIRWLITGNRDNSNDH